MTTINHTNFFSNTLARFTPCEIPTRTPDFISYGIDREVGSMYYYTNDGVVRVSDHWGSVNSCQWNLEGVNTRGFDKCRRTDMVAGYATFAQMQELFNERKRGIEIMHNVNTEEGRAIIAAVISSI